MNGIIEVQLDLRDKTETQTLNAAFWSFRAAFKVMKKSKEL